MSITQSRCESLFFISEPNYKSLFKVDLVFDIIENKNWLPPILLKHISAFKFMKKKYSGDFYIVYYKSITKLRKSSLYSAEMARCTAKFFTALRSSQLVNLVSKLKIGVTPQKV